jgi:hypothetical protein
VNSTLRVLHAHLCAPSDGVGRDFLASALLIHESTVHEDSSFVVWEDVMTTVFREYRDGSLAFIDQMERVFELYARFIHEFDANCLAGERKPLNGLSLNYLCAAAKA